MNSRLLIPLLCAGAVALACGSWSSHSEASVASATVTKGNGDTPRVAKASDATGAAGDESDTSANFASSFAVSVEPHALRFAFDLTNRTSKRVELAFPSGQEYDFTVEDAKGREVYRWGSTRMFTQSMRNKLIGGGETMHIAERAETTLPHGQYVAVATLRSSNFPVSARYPFELR